MILRNYCEVVYTTCMRSQKKISIADCVWDNGLLVDKDWADRNINGAFEMAVTVEASRDRQELTPDPKLVFPTDVGEQIMHISASAGTY